MGKNQLLSQIIVSHTREPVSLHRVYQVGPSVLLPKFVLLQIPSIYHKFLALFRAYPAKAR